MDARWHFFVHKIHIALSRYLTYYLLIATIDNPPSETMTKKIVFPSLRSILVRPRERDRAFHDEKCELDRAVHVKYVSARPAASVHPQKIRSARSKKIGNADDVGVKLNKTVKPLPPSERYELRKFEQNCRAFETANDVGKHGLVDAVYHDQVVHMMDGVPTNKTSVKCFYLDMESRGTKWSAKDFEVTNGSHTQPVIHSRDERMKLSFKGKNAPVGKIRSARAA